MRRGGIKEHGRGELTSVGKGEQNVMEVEGGNNNLTPSPRTITTEVPYDGSQFGIDVPDKYLK